jgi:phage terminase large subunit-like protein
MPRSVRKIDAAVAMVMAVDRAQWHSENTASPDYDAALSVW